jgi:SAM-dependent methyltransferase
VSEELVGPEIFDEDYLWFMEDPLEERSDAEVELILRLLELPAGAAVLDAPCGHGRIANRLASRDLRVVGLDGSRRFLEIARERASEAGVSVEYVEGDLRKLSFEGRFDAVVNWFTSFGYFDDEGNRRVLEGFHRALKPGGALLIEQASRDFLLSNLPASGQAVWMTERGDDLLIDKVTFDADVGRSRTERIIVRDGRVRRMEFSLPQPSLAEFADMLREAGFTDVRALDESGEEYKTGSRRILMLARSASAPAEA